MVLRNANSLARWCGVGTVENRQSLLLSKTDLAKRADELSAMSAGVNTGFGPKCNARKSIIA